MEPLLRLQVQLQVLIGRGQQRADEASRACTPRWLPTLTKLRHRDNQLLLEFGPSNRLKESPDFAFTPLKAYNFLIISLDIHLLKKF